MKLLVIIISSVFCFVACQSNSGGHGEHSRSSENTSNKAVLGKDLVCDMDVTDSTYKSDYEGKTYFFCAEHCKEEFSKDPQKYLGKK